MGSPIDDKDSMAQGRMNTDDDDAKNRSGMTKLIMLTHLGCLGEHWFVFCYVRL